MEIQKEKLQELMNTSTKYQKTLLFQVIQLKDSTFEKAKLTQDANVHEGTQILPAKKGESVWILNKEVKDDLVRVQSVDSFQHGLLPLTILQNIPKDATPRSKKMSANTSVVEEARNALGEVTRQEKIDRLAKFFGTSTNQLSEAVQKPEEDEKTSKASKKDKKSPEKVKKLKLVLSERS